MNNAEKISFVIATHQEDEYKQSRPYLDRMGAKDVIAIRGAKSIFTAYDEGWQKAAHDVVCFLHEDVELHSMDEEEIFSRLGDPKTGFLGVAGSRRLGLDCMWWNPVHQAYLSGQCRHRFPTEENLDVYGPYGRVVVLDGMLLITRKDVLQAIGGFADPPLDGFHFYDISATFRAHMRGYFNYTIPMEVVHRVEPTVTGAAWKANNVTFLAKYWQHLPCTVPLSEGRPGESAKP